ncbi:MAG: TraR/DksA C4-type zinc finger protein [Verrucomicrobiota bacterium]
MATKSKISPKAKPTSKKAVKKASVKPAKKPAAPAPKAKKPAAKPAKKATPAKPVKKSLPAKRPAQKAKPAPAAKAVKKSKPAHAAKKTKTPPVPAKQIKPPVKPPGKKPPVQLVGFLAKQRARLLTLKDTLLDSMTGVAKDSLRSRAEGSEASAFGMHQADAGSDAYDRDFALSLLSQEQDSLYEIDEALKRIDTGSYGICEISSKPILHARLEALPFTRYTVECQSEIEKKNRYSRVRQPVASLFGLGDDEGGDGDDDDSSTDSKE